MRKHLSVLGLAARGAVGRILLITVLTAALAGALLYLVYTYHRTLKSLLTTDDDDFFDVDDED